MHAYVYDGRGRKISEDAGDPALYTQYRYDALGRLTKTIYPAGQQAWFFHDKDGKATEARLYRSDGTLESTTRAAYDPRGRRTSESWQLSGVTYTLSYSYDPAGNMTSMTYPDGYVAQFAYDGWNRLVAIPGLFGQSEFSPGFSYRDTGFLEGIVRANGIATTITPDVRLRPVSMQDTALAISYTYDGEGNVMSQSGLLYGYDGLDRLTSAQVPGAAGGVRIVAYTYDKVGNRLSEAWDGGTPKNYTYNTGNYLASAGGTTYSYGKFGELRQKQASGTTTEYIYDGSRRMAQVKVGGTEAARYVYDAFGRRISATAGGVTCVTLFLGNDIVYEIDGAKVTKYIVAGGRHLAKVVTHTGIGDPPPPQEQYGTFYFHTDLVGSIRAVTNASGSVVARYDYEPFGLTARSEGALAGRDVHKFTGKPEDAETGLYYFNARYYDPELGRFVSEDPFQEGPNPYAYCALNPLRHTDPSGMMLEAGPGGGEEPTLSAWTATTYDSGWIQYFGLGLQYWGDLDFGMMLPVFENLRYRARLELDVWRYPDRTIISVYESYDLSEVTMKYPDLHLYSEVLAYVHPPVASALRLGGSSGGSVMLSPVIVNEKVSKIVSPGEIFVGRDRGWPSMRLEYVHSQRGYPYAVVVLHHIYCGSDFTFPVLRINSTVLRLSP